MINVKNDHSFLSLYGAPLINDKGLFYKLIWRNVVGMIVPANHDLL